MNECRERVSGGLAAIGADRLPAPTQQEQAPGGDPVSAGHRPAPARSLQARGPPALARARGPAAPDRGARSHEGRRGGRRARRGESGRRLARAERHRRRGGLLGRRPGLPRPDRRPRASRPPTPDPLVHRAALPGAQRARPPAPSGRVPLPQEGLRHRPESGAPAPGGGPGGASPARLGGATRRPPPGRWAPTQRPPPPGR